MEALLKLIALFFILFFILVVLFRVYVHYKLSKMKGRSVELIDNGILYFYSERCGACKVMTPKVESIKDKVNVVMVDVFSLEGSKIARDLGIVATPTTLLVKNGKILKSFVGVIDTDKLLKDLSSKA